MQGLLGVALVLGLFLGPPAGAVIIASGDGTGNTSAPLDDPGFAHVGVKGGLCAVYIGDGWVLTANHVHPGDVEIQGVSYRAVPGSDERLLTDGVDPADLILFQIESDPGLASLLIAADPPAGEVVMIGRGKNRGDPIYDWDPSPDLDGWYWGPGGAMRWGTNEVKNISVNTSVGGRTIVLTTDFSGSRGTAHECQVAVGDSGGAVFSKNGDVWELAGIQVARTELSGQPESTALFGNESWSAQLSHYRDQILDIVAESGPACSNGMDDDGDGLLDFPDDPGCLGVDDAFERSADLPCDDGFDNDGDGGVDFDPVTALSPGDETNPPAGGGDPGCGEPASSLEAPACQDGSDNDGDGTIDYDGGQSIHGYCSGGTCPPYVSDPDGDGVANPDSQCVGKPWRNSEASPSPPYFCGLGVELVLLLPTLIWLQQGRSLSAAWVRFYPRG